MPCCDLPLCITAPCNKILAQPGTITGSIGVIFMKLNVKDALEEYGVTGEQSARKLVDNRASKFTQPSYCHGQGCCLLCTVSLVEGRCVDISCLPHASDAILTGDAVSFGDNADWTSGLHSLTPKQQQQVRGFERLRKGPKGLSTSIICVYVWCRSLPRFHVHCVG